jgi:hypothetical protein
MQLCSSIDVAEVIRVSSQIMGEQSTSNTYIHVANHPCKKEKATVTPAPSFPDHRKRHHSHQVHIIIIIIIKFRNAYDYDESIRRRRRDMM